ncbi:hypothetical protein GCM10009557_26290 [Virgisporangium ochraceum]|uniref:DUF1877 domain-containing protein n=1 Tax=Virgisporangium ochraceum TaxID=65505 RepID=A0A8J4EKL2_9ACTN|nr:hypothetical protein [Virgisporangium ochraceum]GIJ75477.1 hypothetical protein Voc01_103940 [Virgisporangium ochraceum]
MAVTQQLAKLSAAELAACRNSVEVLDLLCSFKLRPASDHLDLDWAPAPLVRSFELAHVDEPVVAALRRSLHGDEEINAAYRDHPDTVWEHPVTALEPDVVAEVAALLTNVRPEVVMAAVPDHVVTAQTSLGVFTFDERRYLHGHLVALQDFYAHAARQHLAVALWSD